MTQRRALKFLLVDDDPQVLDLMRRILQREGHRVETAASAEAGREKWAEGGYAAVFTDLHLPGHSGMELLTWVLSQSDREVPIVLITGMGTTDTAIRAMRAGAFDYLTKPFGPEELLELVARIEQLQTGGESLGEGGVADSVADMAGLIGRSRAMERVFKAIGRVAASNATVLITGETGTGKELVARAVHRYSDRHANPWVVVHCGAIPETLLESELFGHEKGAFTGASHAHKGLLESAAGGMVFLDEIGELSAAAQVKLLRFLQEKTIQPVGGTRTIALDVRVVTATHRDLLDRVNRGLFRADLYYRLKVAHIPIPPLRDRGEDLLLLLRHFIDQSVQQYGVRPIRFDSAAIARLKAYPWPGNVRQLENLVKQLAVEHSGRIVGFAQLESKLHTTADAPGSFDAALSHYIRDCLVHRPDATGLWREVHGQMEEILLRETLAHTAGHQSRAASLLGITMKTLREKLLSHGLHPRQCD